MVVAQVKRRGWAICWTIILPLHTGAMADSVSFENVLRELDEANARYFALTLKSKASRYKLVCTLMFPIPSACMMC